MPYCDQCEQTLSVKVNFCPSCGASLTSDRNNNNDPAASSKKGNSVFLITLCILTIIGSVTGIMRGLIYQVLSSNPYQGNTEYVRGILFALFNLGTIAGAIFLLYRKNIGLYVYSTFQILYLILVLWTTSVYLGDYKIDMLAVSISMGFFLPSLAFLLMYWTKAIRNNLH